MSDPTNQEGPIEVDQFWRCPKCGMAVGMGQPAHLYPPSCSMGHAKTEMEQVTAEGFIAEQDDDDA